MRIEVRTEIAAPPETCFDLARDIDFHQRTMAGTSERAVAGVTSGLIGPGEEVTREARHLGIRHRLAVQIVEFDRPHHFRDCQVRGPFRRFDHVHRFKACGDRTNMIDEIEFAAPRGPIGPLLDRLVLAGHLRRLIVVRGEAIRDEAERVTRSARSDGPC